MARRKRDVSKYVTSDGFAYMTKRTLLSKARSAGKIAAKNAMEVMGYIVTVKDGWVVKQHDDGRIEQIEQLELV